VLSIRLLPGGFDRRDGAGGCLPKRFSRLDPRTAAGGVAAFMLAAAGVESWLGVDAERTPLERIAAPLSAHV